MGAVYCAGQGKVRSHYFRQHYPADEFPFCCGAVGTVKKKKMSKGNPLKSVISIGNMDDTSLALPSVNQTRTAQQRVMEQVQSIKRTKSRIRSSSSSRSGSTLSPTSPLYDSVFEETQKSPQSTANGIVFFKNGFSRSLSQEKNNAQEKVNISMGSNVKRYTAPSHYKKLYAPAGLMGAGRGDTSRSKPDLLSHQHSMPPCSVPSKRIQTIKGGAHSSQKVTSQFIINRTAAVPPPPQYAANGQIKSSNQFICSRIDTMKVPKPAVTESTSPGKKVDSGSNGNTKVADITMKEAVEYLSSAEETFQHCGASYIQHNTFINNKAKEEVLKLNGIPPLVNLLHSPSLQVNSTASAALRNLSFKNDKNKEEIQRCGGITQAATLLHEKDSLELQKQLTGLLWNLSSVDSLKPELLKNALPVLIERVIQPYTTGSNQETDSSKNPEIFIYTTGCLKNLSSSKQSYRQTMRKCPNLIDSLVSYIGSCVAAGKPDDESAENCVCILHNLTFRLEAEAPDLFSRIKTLNMNMSNSHNNASPVGCFSTQSKSPEHVPRFDFAATEDSQAVGSGWLFHSKTLGSYLSLLSSSQRAETQEACCGALQNLTAHEGIVSTIMGQTIVQKLGGLRFISPLLNSKKVNLQRSTVALLGNLTLNPVLHSAISQKGLPELLDILSNGTAGANESDDILSMACQASSCLLLNNPEMNKKLLNSKLINSLNDISKNMYFPKSSKAAALLLYKLWSNKDLQSFLKKEGMSKSSFVNDTTIAAQQSLQGSY